MGTYADANLGFLPSAVPISRPIASGSSETFGFTMRFALLGTSYLSLVSDVLATYLFLLCSCLFLFNFFVFIFTFWLFYYDWI